MKRHIFTLAAGIGIFTTTSATEQPDTLMTRTGASSVVITESPSGLKVVVRSTEDGDASESVFVQDYAPDASVKTNQSTASFRETTFNDMVIGVKVKNRHWSAITGGFCLGLVSASGQPDGLGMQWGKSFEISWINALAVRYSSHIHSVSLGIGFDWRNYKITTSGHRLCLNGLGGIGTAPYPGGAFGGGSRIKVFSLGVPLLYTVGIPRTTLSVTLGGILNFNTHASLKTWYTTPEGNRMEEYSEDFHPRRVSVDFFGSLNLYKGCGLYVRYSPNTVLDGHGSPSFRPLSAGIMLFL